MQLPNRPITVAALQARQLTFVSPAAWSRAREPLVAEAAARGAELVVIAGRPGWDEISDEGIEAAARLARRHRLILVANLGFERDDAGCAYAAASVFSPDGARLGCQRQTRLDAADLAMLLSPGRRLCPIPTPLGSLGLLLGEDGFHPDAARELVRMGARILVHLGEMPAGRHGSGDVRSVLQATGVCWIGVYPVGQGLVGESCVVGPGGALALAPDPAAEAVVVATLG